MTKRFEVMVVAAEVCQIASVDSDTVSGNILPRRIAIFPVAIQCEICQINRTHLRIKEMKKID